MFETTKLDDGTSLLVETFGRPIVYLDNWALNDIATESTLCSRFTSAMTSKAGTLRISVSNTVELLKQTDAHQIEQILRLIDAVDTGFININFQEVIMRENQIVTGIGNGQNPSEDLATIKTFLLALNWPKSWTISDIVRHVLSSNDNMVFVQSYDSFADRMDTFIRGVRTDDKYMKKSCARSRAARREKPKYGAATRELASRSFDFIFQNKEMKMPGKEWHDLYHTIVPTAYCDIVFLDRRWATFVSQSGLTLPAIAEVFSRQSLEAGIAAIEMWTSPTEVL
jgi:hypothetical protein